MDIRSTQLLTTLEAAEQFQCTVQHIRLLIRTGKVAGQKIGRDWFIDRESLNQYQLDSYAKKQPTKLKTVVEQRPLFENVDLHPIVNVSSVPQRSPFRYPGGKTWLVPIARAWLESLPHKPTRLVEPFAGGAGIGLMAAFESRVSESLLVEIDPDIASVWQAVLSDDCIELQKRIRDFNCYDAEVRSALSKPPRSDLDRAFQTILRNRVSRGGILAPGAGLVKNGEGNKGIASRWYPETISRRIQAIFEHRSRVIFRKSDGIEAIREHEQDSRVAFFVDPPYPVAGRRLYTFHDLDHRHLFKRLSRVKGPFLATYDQNQTIKELADEFGFQTKLVPMKSTHHTKKLELVISRDLSWLQSGEEMTPSSDLSDQVPEQSEICACESDLGAYSRTHTS